MSAHAVFSSLTPFSLSFNSRQYNMSSEWLALSITAFFEKVPGSVDARGRVSKAVQLCAKECVDIHSPADLVGATVKSIVDGMWRQEEAAGAGAEVAGAVSLGLQAFLTRAIDLADE